MQKAFLSIFGCVDNNSMLPLWFDKLPSVRTGYMNGFSFN